MQMQRTPMLPAFLLPKGSRPAAPCRHSLLPLARLLRLCLCAAVIASALAAIDAQAQAQALDLGEPPAAWQSLFSQLAAHPRIESHFAERRFFAFRKSPRRLEGTMYFHKDYGMALDYQSPSRYTVFVRPTQGIRIARGDGASESVPDNAAATAMLRIMPRLMQFSAPALAEDFSATTEGDPQGPWQLSLRPLERAQLPHIQEIRLSGEGGQLQRLVLVRGTNDRSEIDLRTVRFPNMDEPLALDWEGDNSNK